MRHWKPEGPDPRQEAAQALLKGEVSWAQDLLADVLPGLLDASGAQVGVLRCRPGTDAEQRRRMRERLEKALNGRALVALSPFTTSDVLVLYPVEEQGAGGELTGALHQFCPPDAGLQVGIGRPSPWGHVLESHAVAVQPTNLRSASRSPRSLTDEGVRPLWMTLAGVQVAREWAALVSDAVADAVRDEDDAEAFLLEVALTAARGPSEAARAFGGGRTRQPGKRNVLSKRLERLLERLELSSEADAAIFLLWSRLQALAPPTPAPSAERTFEDLRTCDAARQWARDFLRPLAPEQRQTLNAWFAKGSTADAAAVLDVTVRTVQNRIAQASKRLSRSLLRSQADRYEVLIALLVEDGELAQRMVHDPATRVLTSRHREVPSPGSFVGARWGAVLATQYEEDERKILQRLGSSQDEVFYRRLSGLMPLADIFGAIRRFRREATAYAALQGITQCVDVGCLPPETSLLHHYAPRARWVLADDDPFVLMGIEKLLVQPPLSSYDMDVMPMDHHFPERMLDDLADHDFDLSAPIAWNYGKGSNLLTPRLARRTAEALPPGSLLIMAQLDDSFEDLHEGLGMMRQARLTDPARPLSEFRELFDGLDLVSPDWSEEGVVSVDRGVVPIGQWRRAPNAPILQGHPSVYAGVGVVPPR